MTLRLLCSAFILLLPGTGWAQRYSAASEGQLDSLYGPLMYLMRQEQRGIYPSLSLDAKREFLERFWAGRDPTPGTPRNEAQETFNRRIAEVNRKFHERGTSDVPGWRTDRGRIYLARGAPDIVLSRRGPGPGLPFEAWRYTQRAFRKYLFLDLTRFGNYVLVYSTDQGEPSRPGWRLLVSEEVAEEVMGF